MISNALLLVSTISSVGVDNGQSITPPMYVSDLLCPACFIYLYSFFLFKPGTDADASEEHRREHTLGMQFTALHCRAVQHCRVHLSSVTAKRISLGGGRKGLD